MVLTGNATPACASRTCSLRAPQTLLAIALHPQLPGGRDTSNSWHNARRVFSWRLAATARRTRGSRTSTLLQVKGDRARARYARAGV